MAKLIIMQGLPGSGKSTEAEKMTKEGGNAIRINRDLLRKMLHFDKWSGRNEKITIEAAEVLARHFLSKNHIVIIDDTNLNVKTFERWHNLATEPPFPKVQVVHMTTPMEECIRRDALRDNPVGEYVIKNMARQNGLFDNGKKDVLVDMDGTLADVEHRRHFVAQAPKDWKSFFQHMVNDPVREEVKAKVLELAKDYNIVVVSARPEDYGVWTHEWLRRHEIPYQTLIMRRAGDSRDDSIVKQEILDKYFKKENIALVIDDRPRVIRMWRENGLEVLDVGTGEEF